MLPAMDRADIDRVAARIAAANRSRERFRPLRGADAPTDLDDAYRIQERVDRLLGGANGSAGHKIALASKAVQELCGIDSPAYGALPAAGVRRSPAALKASAFVRLGLEFEIAVTMGRDAPPEDAPWDRESIADRVAHCAPAFETVDDRGADYADLDAASVVADRCWCAGAVLGPPSAAWRGLDLAAAPAALTWNGEIVDRGTAGASMGHPFEGLAWVANHLAARGRTLAAGEIVITGSALATRFPEPGDEIAYAVEGLGEARVRVAA